MKKILFIVLLAFYYNAYSQTFENHYTRSLHDVMHDLEIRFHVHFKYNVDTVGKKLPYADFRIRPYSLEESLTNILAPFDYVWNKQPKDIYKIKPYEYPRRTEADGQKLLAYLSSLYSDRQSWELRRDSLRKEVRARLGIDEKLKLCSEEKSKVSPIRKYDGYTVQNFCMKTIPGRTVCGSIYTPLSNGKHALIICPDGHFNGARYRKDEQQRLATLARMGAVCVDYDLYGWGESADEVGAAAHQTAEAHVMQALNGERILDWMIKRNDIDTKRVGVNGGSGGGTHTVLLTVLDNRITAAAPTVSLSSWFDGGCPCESGKPIQLSGGGTCNPELLAMFAPRPVLVVSDGGDWTESVPRLEYPYLQRIYGFYNAKDQVRNVHLPKEHHDFGINKRNAVYEFFIDVFHLNKKMWDESKVTIVDEATLRFNIKK